ncbi:hypothetical protein QA612_15210 [Evansella sp. AB-P1]|uniref:hypothetical protein n=1 Tax=Evansella sp. AB-P1 TaxID=3037653 RepID=UPI00241EA03B|nr:hypothetical protein [Evansella sp. AB-P1]MDG5788819.1 hypothetical protein [Evansella sp. AB-P1]
MTNRIENVLVKHSESSVNLEKTIVNCVHLYHQLWITIFREKKMIQDDFKDSFYLHSAFHNNILYLQKLLLNKHFTMLYLHSKTGIEKEDKELETLLKDTITKYKNILSSHYFYDGEVILLTSQLVEMENFYDMKRKIALRLQENYPEPAPPLINIHQQMSFNKKKSRNRSPRQ